LQYVAAVQAVALCCPALIERAVDARLVVKIRQTFKLNNIVCKVRAPCCKRDGEERSQKSMGLPLAAQQAIIKYLVSFVGRRKHGTGEQLK
jgi:hypothetical protein